MLLQKITSRFQPGSAARDVATLTFGTVIAQGIAIAVTPLLARLYTPSDFGLLAVFLAVVSVGATLVTLRYETSILLPKVDIESANLVLLSLILGGGLSIVLALLSALLPMALQEKMGLSALGNWIPIAILTAGTASTLAVMQGWMNRQKKYSYMAWLRVGQSAGVAGLSVCLGLLDTSHGLLIAQIIASACLCLIAMWLGRSATHLWQKHQLQATAYAHQNAPKYLLPTALLDVITLQVPVVLIAARFGADDAGQLSMSMKALALPAALIGGAVSQVFFQKISSDIHLGIDAVRHRYIKVSKILGALSTLPTITIALYGTEVFSFLLGDQWQKSGQMAEWLIFSTMIYFIFSPTTSIFIILNKQKILLFFGLIQPIYRIGAALFFDSSMDYIKWLSLCELINVIFIESIVIYYLTCKSNQKKSKMH